MGKLYIGIVTLSAVPVTPANARGVDGKHDPVVWGYGIGNFDYGYRGLGTGGRWEKKLRSTK
jgi:hypothetical protein